VQTFGYYLGEVIRRVHGGIWHDEEMNAQPVLLNVGSRQIRVEPFAAVRERFAQQPGAYIESAPMPISTDLYANPQGRQFDGAGRVWYNLSTGNLRTKGGTRMAGQFESEGLSRMVDFRLFPPSEGATEETELLTRLIEESEKEAGLEQEERVARAAGIREEWRAAVLGLVGEENWNRWMAYSREQRETLYGLKGITPDPKGEAALAEAKRRAIDASYQMMKEASISPDELKALHHRYGDMLLGVLTPEEPKVQRLRTVGEEYIGLLPVIKEDPWTTLRPPYDGQHTALDLWNPRGEYNQSANRSYLDLAVGSVGGLLSFACSDASDNTPLSVISETSVYFWYRTPRAGQVEIWAKVRCAGARVEIWLDDEWGWSESDTDLDSSLLLKISGAPDIQYRDTYSLWQYSRQGNPDNSTESREAYRAGTIRQFVFTSEPIPAGVMTCIKIGTRDYIWSVLNDVSAQVTLDSQWVVDEAQCRMV
jgi:hypothetical protein